MTTTNDDSDRMLTVTMMVALGLARGYLLGAIRGGRLKAIRAGRGRTARFLVRRSWLDAFLDVEAAAIAPAPRTRSLRDLMDR